MFRFWSLALMVAVILLSSPLQAKDFPTKNIKIIVPFSPGGGVDVTARIFAEIAPKYLNGKQLIIENIYTGGSLIAQAMAAKAEPDGYTVLAYTSSVVSNPIFNSASFDYTDFNPFIMYCFDPEVIVVTANSSFNSVKDFLSASKKQPISMATSGTATAHHIAALMIEKNFDAQFKYVHLTSAAEQVSQLLDGKVQSAMMAYGETVKHLQDGSLRVLGMMSDAKYAGAENIKRFSKMGFKTEWGAFRGFAVPAKTPKAVADKLSALFIKITKDKEFIKKMNDAGYPIVVLNSNEFSDYINQNARILLDMKTILQAN